MPPLIGGSAPTRQRPPLRVCYLCGQQFGSASIGIHVPQCYQKKLSQWETANPTVRGPKPRHPDTTNWKGGDGASVEATNSEQYTTFNAQLMPCPHCGRTFLPDRLQVHLRGCKGDSNGSTSPSKAKLGGSTATGTSRNRPESKASSRCRSVSPGPPLLPTCYMCGQQFGTASIGIHVPQCYEKKTAQWQNADPRTRGQPPKHPDSVNWRGRPDASAREQAEEQFQEFINNLEPCPNCGRKFLPDRLLVHLRSCKADNPARVRSPSPGRTASASTARASGSATPGEREAQRTNGSISGGKLEEETESEGQASLSPTKEDRLHPKRNRLPRHSALPAQSRVCLQCEAVEYDVEAKFCRECGHNFGSLPLSDPCQRCGERIPLGSRFCGTCGQPVQGASEVQRTPADAGKKPAKVRQVVCPACEVMSDADGNFCDNCGAALGSADLVSPSPSPPLSSGAVPASALKRKLYCAICKELVEDVSAVFCEDCGSPLEELRVPVDRDAAPPPSDKATLAPSDVAHLSSRKALLRPPQEPGGVAATASPKKALAPAPAPKRTEKAAPVSSFPAGPTLGKEQNDMKEEPAPFEDELPRVPCRYCERRFAPESLAKHEHACSSQKKRRVFNTAKQRLPEEAVNMAKVPAPTPPKVPKKDWKAESEAFRRALREARQVDQVLKAGGTAKDLPPPTYSINPNYVPCPHCQRRFAPDVASRHIPHCANTMNRPKPPPRRR